MIQKRFLTACLLAVSIFQAYSQTGVLRGFVYEATTGEPVISAFVTFQGVRMGAYTDEKGF